MDISTAEQMVTSVGFPILCVIGLAYFIFYSYKDIKEENKTREAKLYTTLEKSQAQLDKLEETNADFVKVLESFKEDQAEIKKDVSDIKEIIEDISKNCEKKGEQNG